MRRPLEGIRVLDLTQAYSGPFCTMNLADHGAEVIKIEPPNGGDQTRAWGPLANDYSGYFAYINRNKKGMTLNLKSEEGKKIFTELLKTADVVCENYKVGVLERLGFSYEVMKEINPRIIYGSISGHGLTGDLATRPAYDIVAQAMSGMMSVTGFQDGPPCKIGPSVGDNYSGAYLCMGILMALKKEKLIDKLGTLYIVFITAVPSLAYIFLFKSLGGKFGLPTTFDMENPTWLMYVLPIISLALPSIANLMKWLRRYMIDQMNSDYVKFARSGGLSEGEIFSKHVLKNAIIPIVHGIPGSILFAMTGAIITERVYVVPGAGNMLTKAINAYDNGVIVGVTLFYAVISVTAVILGDVLMSMMDPRISFTTKAR